MPEFDRELALAIALATTAGQAVMAARGHSPVTRKAKGEPVTEADLEANRIILEGLTAAFPADAILSEETPSTTARQSSKRVWIIDPIDGTAEFIGGTEDFAIQIGLAIDGVPVMGVVHQVAKKRLYLAAQGQGAWLQDPSGARTRLATSLERDIGKMSLTVSRFHRSKKNDAVIAAVKPASIVPAGSIGVKMGLVAKGSVDLYLHPSKSTSEWDTCAPEVVVTEAGGVVTDFRGQPLRYNQPDPHHPLGIAVTNGKVHGEVLERITPIFGTLGF